jgi:hypothetical protein
MTQHTLAIIIIIIIMEELDRILLRDMVVAVEVVHCRHVSPCRGLIHSRLQKEL